MSKQAESKLSSNIIKALNARGHYVFKHHATAFSKVGATDIMGCSSDGIGIFLETKRPCRERKDFRPEQQAFCARMILRSKGKAIVAVVSSVEEAIAAVEAPFRQSVIEADGFCRRAAVGSVPLDARAVQLALDHASQLG